MAYSLLFWFIMLSGTSHDLSPSPPKWLLHNDTPSLTFIRLPACARGVYSRIKFRLIVFIFVVLKSFSKIQGLEIFG